MHISKKLVALLALGLLACGTVLASLLIFGPVQRRLAKLEDATRQLGAGDLSARAPEKGGDEKGAGERTEEEVGA